MELLLVLVLTILQTFKSVFDTMYLQRLYVDSLNVCRKNPFSYQ